MRELPATNDAIPDPSAPAAAYLGDVGWRVWCLASATTGMLATAVYVTVIAREGDDSIWVVLPWVLLMVAGSGASLWAGLSNHARVARRMATGAAIVLAVVGVLGILSVGLGFVLAALLAAVGAVRASLLATR